MLPALERRLADATSGRCALVQEEGKRFFPFRLEGCQKKFPGSTSNSPGKERIPIGRLGEALVLRRGFQQGGRDHIHRDNRMEKGCGSCMTIREQTQQLEREILAP